MLNVESKPVIFVDKPRHLIKITGHYSDVTRCAKLTLLCEKYKAKVLKDGYAEVPYSEEFLADLNLVNEKRHFSFTAAAIIASLIAAAATGISTGVSSGLTRDRQNSMRDFLRNNYDLTDAEIGSLVSKYGDKGGGIWDISNWGDQSDWTGLKDALSNIITAHAQIGDMPQALTIDQLNQIENDAYGAIDAENRQLFDLFDQTSERTNNLLQENLEDNQQAYLDYRNQLLTNSAMQQQAIAGSARYELERSQRNAIVRGASAAQRLVANINTQLGMQAKAAQQSLDTSNALAQQLLAHRQAQAGLRQDYVNSLNQNTANRAGVIQGSAERKANYANAQMDHALAKNQYARDAWNDRVADYFSGDSVGQGIYRRRYGGLTNNSNNNTNGGL